MMCSIRFFVCATAMVFAVLAAWIGNAAAQGHGTWTGIRADSIYAGGTTFPGPGEVYTHVNSAQGYGRATSLHWGQGLNSSHSYIVRRGDGRYFAFTHQLGYSSQGGFFGSSAAGGFSDVETGGFITWPGAGSNYLRASPHGFHASGRSFSRSYR